MGNNQEQNFVAADEAAACLPEHILENLSSPVLRAAWMLELKPDLQPVLPESKADEN